MQPVADRERGFAAASSDFRFAAAVALFGMGLRESPHRGMEDLNRLFAAVEDIAISATGEDRGGYRAEFVGLVRAARALRQ